MSRSRIVFTRLKIIVFAAIPNARQPMAVRQNPDAAQRSAAHTHIGDEIFKPLKAPRLAAVFGDACSRTELASSLRDGSACAHAVLLELFNTALEMKPNLLVEFTFKPAATENMCGAACQCRQETHIASYAFFITIWIERMSCPNSSASFLSCFRPSAVSL
jgi:hypothetical protein